jgi:hypothetical protein
MPDDVDPCDDPTKIQYPISSVSRDLPPDLSAASNLGINLAIRAEACVLDCRYRHEHRPSDSDTRFYAERMFEQIKGLSDSYDDVCKAIRPVTNELSAVRNEPARVGTWHAANAHLLALDFAKRLILVVDRAADPDMESVLTGTTLDSFTRNFCDICKTVSERDWPDSNELRAVIEFEAGKAAAARHQSNKQLRNAIVEADDTVPEPGRAKEATETAAIERQASPINFPASAPDLARLLGESVDAVDSRLRRFRVQYPDCYIALDKDDLRRTDAKYLYRQEVVPLLREHFERQKRRKMTDHRRTET